MSEVTVKFSVTELEEFSARIAQAVVAALKAPAQAQGPASKQPAYPAAPAQPQASQYPAAPAQPQAPQYPPTAPRQQAQPQQQAPAGYPYQMPPQAMPSQPAAPTAQPQYPPQQTGQPGTPLPTQGQPAVTLEALSTACGRYAAAGDAQRNSILCLMQQFGVNAMTALPQEQYGAFAAKLREMGVVV